MVQGTASHVGKSVLVTALCKILSEDGYKVAPYKSQNMSLNSWVTSDDEEIGIAQAMQAKAAGIEPTSDMNPILLKPKGDGISQVVVLGKPLEDRMAGDYYDSNNDLFEIAKNALDRLSEDYDIIVMEGAGSPAEINLYDKDIANMRIANHVRAKVILVADIERGGVFASLYGTIELIPKRERDLIKGIIINKFRGDLEILKPGLVQIEELTGVPVIGVLPYTELGIPSEDSVSLYDKQSKNSQIEIAVIRLPRISNFTDFEPLEPYANVRYVSLNDLDGIDNADAIIIPGTKNTTSDLSELKKSKISKKIINKAGKVPIIGICGGYQMLGREVIDQGIEDGYIYQEGLGLLDLKTTFEKYEKTTKQVTKKVTCGGPIFERIKDEAVTGYEIHMGQTVSSNPIFEDDGCIDGSGLIFGTYLHGLFENDNFREAFLSYLYDKKNIKRNEVVKKDSFNELANFVRKHIDLVKVYEMLE